MFRKNWQPGITELMRIWKPRGLTWIGVGVLSGLMLVALSSCLTPTVQVISTPYKVNYPLDQPVRDRPATFPANSHMPPVKEYLASGANDPNRFNAARDLVLVHDKRAWWESDQHPGGGENDHMMHRAMVTPLRRLIELASQKGAVLEIRDTYRPEGRIHIRISLHREGRAVDLTVRGISLEELAKLSWMSGFDWVYREGGHVHCSVRPDRADLTPPVPSF